MTIRERYSLTIPTLQNIQTHTPGCRILLIDYELPAHIRECVDTLPNVERIVSENPYPQYNRTLSLPYLTTEYTVFLDNDILVSPNWLDTLLRCASETGAGIVGPLYLTNDHTIHMFGGYIRRDGSDFYEWHDRMNGRLDPSERLERKPCDYVEYHCMLVRTDLLRKGILDPNLTCVHEHIDICLACKDLGYSIYVEPSASVTYLQDAPYQDYDLPFFRKRWSAEQTEQDIAYVCKKWKVNNNHTFENIRNFVRTHANSMQTNK